jgi:hypothetical protein
MPQTAVKNAYEVVLYLEKDGLHSSQEAHPRRPVTFRHPHAGTSVEVVSPVGKPEAGWSADQPSSKTLASTGAHSEKVRKFLDPTGPNAVHSFPLPLSDRITADCVRGLRFLAELTPDEQGAGQRPSSAGAGPGRKAPLGNVDIDTALSTMRYTTTSDQQSIEGRCKRLDEDLLRFFGFRRQGSSANAGRGEYSCLIQAGITHAATALGLRRRYRRFAAVSLR